MPEPGNPQSFNRYSYVYNRPLVAIDPTGHDLMLVGGAGGDLDPRVWKAWIIAYKGWTAEEWDAFYGKWKSASDLASKNSVLAAEGISIFTWGGSTWNGAIGNAGSAETDEMVGELAKQMVGMKDVTLIGWSKGGNLVLHYLHKQARGKLVNATEPLRVVLLAPGVHPLGFVKGAINVEEAIPANGPQAVSICSHGDVACPLTIGNARNINPPKSHGHGNVNPSFEMLGVHGVYAPSVIESLNVVGHHQARETQFLDYRRTFGPF